MAERVLDASVLLAVAKSESFDAALLSVLEGAVLSCVNYTEVVSRLWDLSIRPDSAPVSALFGLLDRIEPFNLAQSQVAADLRPKTRHVGLSFGDRACLALALELDAEVYTADAAWLRVDVGCRIHLIR